MWTSSSAVGGYIWRIGNRFPRISLRCIRATGVVTGSTCRNCRTPGLALAPLRASLTMLASIKNTRQTQRHSKSASSPTSGILANTSARGRRLGSNRAARNISGCSASALRLWDAANCLSAKATSSSTLRTTRWVATGCASFGDGKGGSSCSDCIDNNGVAFSWLDGADGRKWNPDRVAIRPGAEPRARPLLHAFRTRS